MVAEPLERTNLAGGASSAPTLRSESLRDAEAYWRPRGRMLAGLHSSGVAAGLEVGVGVGELIVAPGVALDRDGELVSLAGGGLAVIGTGDPVPVGAEGVAVPAPAEAGRFVLAIAFVEAVDTDHPAALRIRHTPVLTLAPEGRSPDERRVVLAVVVCDRAGEVTRVEPGPRRALGIDVGRVVLRSPAVEAGTVGGGHAGEVRGLAEGIGVRLAPDGADVLRIGRRRTDITVPLRVAGDISTAGGLTVAGAVTFAGAVTADVLATRRLRVAAAGDGAELDEVALDVGGPLRLRGRAGMWLSPDGWPDGAFVGMADDRRVGLWGAELADFGLTMDAGTGAVAVGRDLAVGQDVTVARHLRVAGAPPAGEARTSVDITGRARLRQGADSAGLWFWQTNRPDAAFVGMADDDHVGFWARGISRFALQMDANTGETQMRTAVVDRHLFVKKELRIGVKSSLPDAHDYCLDAADRIRLREGPGGRTAGLWLYQNARPDAAFVGMAADDRVGFWGSGMGAWGLTMDGTTGKVRIRGALTANGQVLAAQGMSVGAELVAEGPAFLAGGTHGYALDYVVNAVGDVLEEGDVVVLGGEAPAAYCGARDAVPVPEVDLTDRAVDPRVCGIIAAAVAPLDGPADLSGEPDTPPAARPGPPAALAAGNDPDDLTRVRPGQMARLVTLGSFARCKVDADAAPIAVGDLLTTSATRGHAAKVVDRQAATGAVLGKALGSLTSGRGCIPVLVSLH